MTRNSTAEMPQHGARHFEFAFRSRASNVRVMLALTLGALACATAPPATAHAQAGWLDEETPAGWNEPGTPVPEASMEPESVDPRCRELARPAELAQDSQIVAAGWDLVGGYQGGWNIVVIQGTATYGGMCRPWQYQAFVFVDGIFAGTLSPAPMDSRTDGSLSDVWIQDAERITAQYMRYTEDDALCCPSSKTIVEFEIAITSEGHVVRPTSTSTTSTSDR